MPSPTKGNTNMSVAKIIEISSDSTTSFQDAIETGLKRAEQTLKNVKGAWISEQKVSVSKGQISSYRVIMRVSFILD
jgi:flavin-binding protein dodecin